MGPYLQVAGQWSIRQTNNHIVDINVTQDKDQISAFATHSNGTVKSLNANGHVEGPMFHITIEWNNGTKGQYDGGWKPNRAGMPGAVAEGGYLEGTTVDLMHTNVKAGWKSENKVFYIR